MAYDYIFRGWRWILGAKRYYVQARSPHHFMDSVLLRGMDLLGFSQHLKDPVSTGCPV